MKIEKKWAMPNKNTFSVKPIKEFVERNLVGEVIVDPFANNCKYGNITNDLDPFYDTTYNMDALEFLKTFKDGVVDCVLFDPPYSPRQVSECYKKMGLAVNMQTTQASFWGNMKKEIGRITKKGGIVLSFGWNSNGIGKSNGFEQQEILIVAHGGNHNDTICVKEVKL